MPSARRSALRSERSGPRRSASSRAVRNDETIHPFLDGNGRLGRLLITLLLCAEGVISEPILLRGVIETADEAVDTTRRILALFEKHRRELEGFGRAAASAFRVHEYVQRHPITGVQEMAKALELTYPTVASALERMKKLHIVKELTGFKRHRVFAYSPYVDLLSEGIEPLR